MNPGEEVNNTKKKKKKNTSQQVRDDPAAVAFQRTWELRGYNVTLSGMAGGVEVPELWKENPPYWTITPPNPQLLSSVRNLI